MKTVQTKNGPRYLPAAGVVMEAVEEQTGFCIRCGAEGQSAEPDMRQGECEECGAPGVYGAEELVLRGWLS